MVLPVSTAVPQQIPAANTFQPGGTEATKRPEENKTVDSTRPSGTETARSTSSETRNNGRTEDPRRFDAQTSTSRSSDSGSISASSNRGSNLDISV